MIYTGFEGFFALLPGWRRDVNQGGVMQLPLPWFQWGYFVHHQTGERLGWYVLIGLPSYLVRIPEYAEFTGSTAEPTWHQRFLFFRERVPVPKPGDGWRMIEVESNFLK